MNKTKFTGIDRRYCAADTSCYSAQNVNTANYPYATIGASIKPVKTPGGIIDSIWRGAYSGFGSDSVCDRITHTPDATTLTLTYADATTPLITLSKTLSANVRLKNANRLYYDLLNKYVYYTLKENGKPKLEATSLTEPHTFITDVLLDNTTAGVVVITIWEERSKAYFEPNDNITLSCSNWADNSAHEDAYCFATVEPTETSSKGQAVTYVVSEATVTRQVGGSYKHVYRCTVTAGGGKVFESAFNTVYFGGAYAPIVIGKRFPNLADICFHRNRYAGVSADGTMLMLSAQGSPQQFYDFSGEETDSYYMEFATVGPFTAVASFSDTLVCFKRDVLHVIYGYNPSDYQLSRTINGYGCIDRDSVCECNGYLYFLSTGGICAYMGGTVNRLNNVFGVDIMHAKMVACGNSLACLLTFADGTSGCYMYDTERGVWTELYFDGYSIKDIYADNGTLYITDTHTLGSVVWGDGGGMLESNTCHHSQWGRKSVLRVRIRAYVDDGTLDFYINRDGKGYEHINSTKDHGYVEWDFMVRNIQCKWYRYKICTTGRATITEVEMEVI